MENPAPYIWPANELEEVLTASIGNPSATPRLLEVLSRSRVWVPLPNGGHPDMPGFDLPTMELDGSPYVPVFSSEQQFRQAADGMPCTVAPVHEFARGLPPLVGIAVNPGGAVGVPLPPAAVADLCRAERGGYGAPQSGARVRLWEPAPDEEPVDFLAAAAAEFAVTPVVLTARRALASVEEAAAQLFVGVELDRWQEPDRAAAMDALGRALGAVPLPWQVQLILLDVAQDPVGDWMLDAVRPFFARD
ncbi:SseB protein N-terminal domain-containing protein [Streptomyces sp. DvalAA-14]|uniref:enhanced serine sensitivity protein SseB n=1 Tax=unclassified Streptomyces TaxID=2593676 RepID=UPI00081BC4A6|nr:MULTISPECIES: enhanced serine sensitivity protein SseB [unclassified Streptomyces]MYS20286.1 enhanced serine sensitivity protein SseB [Streptomyces sp. SID4948]SCD65378.1 SseB protein N-terminal domain-containing protein [Streptomyces sp. DvalAA-14]